MALTARYAPSWPPDEVAYVGMDFSDVLPPGLVQITAGTLSIVLNTNPVQPTSDFTQQGIIIQGRQVWCRISGGFEGQDYQFRWTVTDNRGHTWERAALMLCAQSS